MSNTCLFIILGLIFGSSGYLVYMNISREDFRVVVHIRFWIFFAQHLFLAAYLLWNKRFDPGDDMGEKLKVLLVFCGVNFFSFVAFEIFAAVHYKDEADFFGESDLKTKDFAYTSYLHLYYQYNIYNGVFFIFCFVMTIFYVVHQRNQ